MLRKTHGLSRPLAEDAQFSEFLLQRGVVTAEDLAKVEKYRLETGETLIRALDRTSVLSNDVLLPALAEHCGLALIGDDEWPSELLLRETLSYAFLRDNTILPLRETEDSLIVAIADPLNSEPIDSVQLVVDRPIELRLAAAEAIKTTIDRLIVAKDNQALVTATVPSDNVDDIEHLRDLALGAPVIGFVNRLLLDAVHLRATDIHIEPFRNKLVIRLRIDGMLRHIQPPSDDIAAAIVSRVKILSGLNIAERRLPQDGRARVRVDAISIDLRVATVPTIHGEAVAIRVLDNVMRVLDFPKLGFPTREEEILRRHLAASHGLVLVTGPTGSGKTTTLATALKLLNEPHRKILSIEDPVEYQIEGINQVQLKTEIGITFANALRSFLRQDPDVIMVGEMRDTETADIAVHAALTGHLVLSTLHTNSAPGSIPRLLDMGIDGYLLSSSLRCIVGQRLVRTLCPHCKVAYRGSLDYPAHILAALELMPNASVQLWRANGCDRCNETGYIGRIGIIEVLDVDGDIQAMIRPGVTTTEIARRELERGGHPMVADGLRKCIKGLTTLEEIRRVASDY